MNLTTYIEKGNSIKNLKPNQLKIVLPDLDGVIEEIIEVTKEKGFTLKFRFKGEVFHRRVNADWVEV